jgi:hypothetical protein
MSVRRRAHATHLLSELRRVTDDKEGSRSSARRRYPDEPRLSDNALGDALVLLLSVVLHDAGLSHVALRLVHACGRDATTHDVDDTAGERQHNDGDNGETDTNTTHRRRGRTAW